MRTDPRSFVNPHSVANRAARYLWQIVWLLLFRPSPWFMNGWRRFLLRLFGAKIGSGGFHASVRVWAPWHLEVGNDVYVDSGVYLYNPYGIRMGDRCIVSFGACLCTASHDYQHPSLPLIGRPITLANDIWIAAKAFVAPGVEIGDGAVVGACAVVARNVEPWTVVAGNPAKFVKTRTMHSADADTRPAPPATRKPVESGA